MINTISQNTNEANFEQAYVSGCLEEGGSHVSVIIERANLDAGQQTTYDDFIALGQDKSYFNIDNTTCLLSIDRMTSVAISTDTEALDHAAMSGADQSKVDAFCSLIETLTTM